MRTLRLNRASSSYGYGDADIENLAKSSAAERAAEEAAAINQGIAFADWKIKQQASLEQEILGKYNAAMGVLNGAGLPIENVEEGNALIAFLVEHRNSPYDDKAIIDLVKDIRNKIEKGEIEAQVAFADKGQDVRKALFNLAREKGTSPEVKRQAAYLLRLLEVIREMFYLQMILTMQGKPRSAQRDADIQKMSAEAMEAGKEMGFAIETEYTLQMFDKSERLVGENLATIQFGESADGGYIFVSSDPIVDAAMDILSASNQSSGDLFDRLISDPERAKAVKYGMLGLLVGLIFTYMRRRNK